MVYLICSARSGSTSFLKYLQSIKPYSNFRKVLIHRLPPEFNNMLEYGEKLLKQSPESFLLDRKDKQAQAESLCFRKLKYNDNFEHYHHKEFYDKLDNQYLNECKASFIEHSKVLNNLSKKYEKKLLYLEDIIKPAFLKEVGIFNSFYYDKYLDPKHKQRLFTQTNKTPI